MAVIFKVVSGIKAVRVVLWRRKYDGPWYARWHSNGNLHRISTGETMEREARAVARTEVERSLGSPAEARGLPAAAAVKIFLEQHKGRADTTRHYVNTKQRLDKFSHAYGAVDLTALDFDAAVDLILKFMSLRRDQGLGETSIRNDRAVLHAFFGWLTRYRLNGSRVVCWPANPCNRDLVAPPRAEERSPVPIPNDQISTIVKLARETEAWPSVLLILGAGFRPIGVSRLLWRHVLFEQKLIVIEREKKIPRTLPLNDWVLSELRAWHDRCGRPAGDQPVLRVHSDTCHDIMRFMREDPANKLGDNCTLQGLRVTADFRLYQKGVKPQKAGAIMGHLPSTAQAHYVNYELLDAHDDARHLDWSEQKDSKTFPKTFPRRRSRIHKSREVRWF